jgi:hypothetical protein
MIISCFQWCGVEEIYRQESGATSRAFLPHPDRDRASGDLDRVDRGPLNILIS